MKIRTHYRIGEHSIIYKIYFNRKSCLPNDLVGEYAASSVVKIFPRSKIKIIKRNPPLISPMMHTRNNYNSCEEVKAYIWPNEAVQ